ncbi:uncharacterized protein LOC134538682 isoform X2 [Bacillus rossius redtenbacheri]|uniref:uncharacterized protein LOC134538682 isoform X2 n=1 Tax=Bacillus rossius redtenbacheri TaxID=93214 RepID=UPI002FDDB78B
MLLKHSPTPEEGDENVRYIIVDPGALSDESQSSKKRPCWEFWETKTLLGIVKELSDASPGGKAQLDENFFLVEQEMRKRGVERWDGGQIQQKWRSLRKDWLSARRGSYRNGTAKTVSEFQDELDELLGTPESHCSLSGADTSGDEITGYDMESLEPRDHVAVVLDNEDKRSRMVTRRSSGSYPGQKDAQGSPPGTKPSTSSDDGRDADFTPGPVKAKKLKMRDAAQHAKKDLFIWPHGGVLLLLKEYKKVEHEFALGKRHNKIWDDIAKAICSVNRDLKVTGCQCQQKISGLKRTYYSLKEQRSSGSDKISWPYYNIVDKIFGNKGPAQSRCRMPRKSHAPQQSKHSVTSSSSDEGNDPGTSTKKVGVKVVVEQYLQEVKKQRELARLRRERRAEEKEHRKLDMQRQKLEQRRRMHDERITMQRAALDILKQILAKNQ